VIELASRWQIDELFKTAVDALQRGKHAGGRSGSVIEQMRNAIRHQETTATATGTDSAAQGGSGDGGGGFPAGGWKVVADILAKRVAKDILQVMPTAEFQQLTAAECGRVLSHVDMEDQSADILGLKEEHTLLRVKDGIVQEAATTCLKPPFGARVAVAYSLSSAPYKLLSPGDVFDEKDRFSLRLMVSVPRTRLDAQFSLTLCNGYEFKTTFSARLATNVSGQLVNQFQKAFNGSGVDVKNFTLKLMAGVEHTKVTVPTLDMKFYALHAWAKSRRPETGKLDSAAVLMMLLDYRDEVAACRVPTSDPEDTVTAKELQAIEEMVELTVDFITATAFTSSERVGWETLRLDSLKSLLAKDALCLGEKDSGDELSVVKAILRWLRQPRTFNVAEGVEVSVEHPPSSGKWRVCCVTKTNVGEGGLYTDVNEAELPEVPTEDASTGAGVRVERVPPLSLRLLTEHMHSPRVARHTEELLQCVRFPFITLERLKSGMDEHDLAFLTKFPVFRKLLVEATNLQLGKRGAQAQVPGLSGCSERARKRARYGDIPSLDAAKLVDVVLVAAAAAALPRVEVLDGMTGVAAAVAVAAVGGGAAAAAVPSVAAVNDNSESMTVEEAPEHAGLLKQLFL